MGIDLPTALRMLHIWIIKFNKGVTGCFDVWKRNWNGGIKKKGI